MKLALLAILPLLISTQAMNKVTDKNIADLQHKAASGDSETAIELFHYYLSEKNDPAEASFWLRVSAEQGNCAGMIEYGRLLGGALHLHDARESWFKKAAAQGCDMSQARRHEVP